MNTDLFKKYKAELSEEVEITDFNIKDVQLRLPGIKHKWVARLIEQKIELHRLEKVKECSLAEVISTLQQQSAVTFSAQALKNQAENTDVIKKINELIDQTKMMIDYLERVEKVCSSTTYDIKNLVEIKKLELT